VIALTKVRALRALNMRRRGSKLSDISKEFSVTRQRASQLIELGTLVENEILSGDPWFELTARTRNSLINNGCEPTPSGVVTFLAANDWKRIVNYGVKCHAELQAWLERHKESSDEHPNPAEPGACVE